MATVPLKRTGGTPGLTSYVSGPQRVAAFVVVTLSLLVAADLPQTAELAVAFAYLIMVGVLVAAGPTAFARISTLTGGTTP